MKAKKFFLGLLLLLALGLLCPGWGQAYYLTEIWAFTGDQSFTVWDVQGSPAVGDDGTIYAGTATNGYVFALHPDGTLKWVTELGGSFYFNPAIAPDGSIIIHNSDVLFALNPADGSIKWEVHGDIAGIKFYGAPAVSKQGVVYIGSSANTLYAFEPSQGNLKWHFQVTMPSFATVGIFFSPVINAAGTIYCLYTAIEEIGGAQRIYRLYAIEPEFGNPKYPDKPCQNLASMTYLLQQDSWPAIGPDGTIYVAGDHIFAIRPDLSIKWDYHPPSLYGSGSPVIAEPLNLGEDYSIVMDYGYNHIIGVSLQGQLSWDFTADYEVNKPAIGKGRLICFSATGPGYTWVGQLYLLFYYYPDALPEQLDKIEMEGPVYSSSTVVRSGDQNLLYVGSRYSVSAWNIGVVTGQAPGLAHTSWPCDRGNLKRNGRVSVAFSALYSVGQLMVQVDVLHLGNYAVSLGSKLESARQSLEKEDLVPARNKLTAFINEVRALKRKKILARDADNLIADAQGIVGLLQ